MKKMLMLFAGIMLLLALSACGQKSQGDVVSALNEKLEEMKGYKANAKMTLQMGNNLKCIMWRFGIKIHPFTA